MNGAGFRPATTLPQRVKRRSLSAERLTMAESGKADSRSTRTNDVTRLSYCSVVSRSDTPLLAGGSGEPS